MLITLSSLAAPPSSIDGDVSSDELEAVHASSSMSPPSAWFALIAISSEWRSLPYVARLFASAITGSVAIAFSSMLQVDSVRVALLVAGRSLDLERDIRGERRERRESWSDL